MHVPVLLKEVVEYLHPQVGEFAVDGTADGGGHAEAILEKLGSRGKLLAIDWDEETLKECKQRLGRNKNIIFETANYAEISSVLLRKKLPPADLLLLDLGFSSSQVDELERGFSFRKDKAAEPLLMTYSDQEEPLYKILPRLSELELARVIREFGGERFAGRVARAIRQAIRKQPIETSGQLAEVVREALPKHYERGRIDPATRTFQAFRIYVNHEFENLRKFLDSLSQVLAPGGRVGIITFHSDEDRIVKQRFKTLVHEESWLLLTKKAIKPSHQEISNNIRSRSAKLRVIQKPF